MSEKRFSLDDLPHFSPWPARLLGLAPWQARQKTAQEVTREYDKEKWGPLLEKARRLGRAATVEQVDDWIFEQPTEVLCSVNGEFRQMQAREASHHHRQLVAEVLQQYLPAAAVVELGCGYGGIILQLARLRAFQGIPLLGGEYAPSGVELTRLLAAAQGMPLQVAGCDFRRAGLTELAVPRDALVFTSFATHYVPELAPAFVDTIAAWRPRAVVHFEPCYEHCQDVSLLAMLRRKYIEVNDYNRNLITLLHQKEAAGAIRVLEEKRAVFGANPLLPASVVIWTPL
jgi:hypothetical protein